MREAIHSASTDGDDSQITFNLNGTFVIDDGLPAFKVFDDGTIAITGNGAADTVISAQDGVGPVNDTRVFDVQAGAIADFNDLSVTGGHLATNGTDEVGAGINNAGNLTLTRVLVSDNTIDVTGLSAAHGAGIAHVGGTLTVTDSTISDNTILGDGDFEHGAGLMLFAGTTATITGSSISGNESSGGTAGVGNFGATLNISGSTIDDNVAHGTGDGGGGGVRSAFGTTVITNSLVRTNSTSAAGGGILAHGDPNLLTLTDVIVEKNIAVLGAGVLNLPGSSLEASGGNVSGNVAADTAGGVGNLDGDLSLTDVTVHGNSASTAGGVGTIGGDLTVDGGEISENAASDSGGGLLVIDDAFASVTDTDIRANIAGAGGGVAVADATLGITDATVSDNTASESGGGVFMGADGTVTSTGSDIVDNAPNDCGYEDNGAITNGGGSTDSDQTCFPTPPTPPGPPTPPAPDPGGRTDSGDAGNSAGTNGASGGTGATPATLPATGAGSALVAIGIVLLAAGALFLVIRRRLSRSALPTLKEIPKP